jgi:Mg2+-importing ATPase
MSVATDPVAPVPSTGSGVTAASAAPLDAVFTSVRSSADGLTALEAADRLRTFGPNSVASHKARLWPVVVAQLRSPLLVLLLVAAAVSFVVGERTDAVIIGVIVALSVGLGVVNEYRAAKAADLLHDQVQRKATVVRDGVATRIDVADVVPGDVVRLRLGDIVPADVRLFDGTGLACDESVLTGESMPIEKTLTARFDAAGSPTNLTDLANCALMGTVVHAGTGTGVVVATGGRAEFGKIAAGLRTPNLETEFQAGLRKFSMLLVYVAAGLSVVIVAVNVALHRPLLDALLFALAIAVGITPQLLPAVVATSLATGSRRLAARKVLVKRLVCIEDLGNVDVLFTDKTGTLTIGQISFMRAVGRDGLRSADVLRWGLLATDSPAVRPTPAGPIGESRSLEAAGANPLDAALMTSTPARALVADLATFERLAALPFDHDRAMNSVLVREIRTSELTLVVKGAPEAVMSRCRDIAPALSDAIEAEFAAGHRVIAVATRTAVAATAVTADDEHDLDLVGLLVFLDPPKPDAVTALRRLADLGVTVKVITGDNATVATKLCADLGLATGAALSGVDIDRLDDDSLAMAIDATTVFARVTPAQKGRIVRVRRHSGGDVAFLGDGVNDALALHAADVGISVDTGTDVAKDAADVILLEKDLDVLADGVVEGRRIFANTIKYVLMGTSSNFGNMFSAAGASIVLSFLPMLPSQILLNNLLYDSSQLAIPTDNVDAEQLRRPSHWDIAFIRRFMFYFGPFSSLFDFITFGIMAWGFQAGPTLFRSGWFVESLATQTLIIFAIRTKRVPFFRSRPSLALTLSALSVVAIGVLLPASPLSHLLGFQSLPAAFFAALCGLVLAYLALVEVGKWAFYKAADRRPRQPLPRRSRRHARRRIAYFTGHRGAAPARSVAVRQTGHRTPRRVLSGPDRYPIISRTSD